MHGMKPSWRGLLEEGVGHLSRGEYSEAAYWFEAAQGKEPDHPLTCYALGRERMRQGRYYEAESLLRKAADLDPTLLPAAFCLVRLLGLHLDRMVEAWELINKISCLASEMNQKEALLLLRGELELERPFGFVDAQKTFKQVLEMGKRNSAAKEGLSRACNLEGIDLARRGQHEQALFALKKACCLSPGWAAPRVNMGAVFQCLHKPRLALREYRKALALESWNPTALYNLGKIYLQLDELGRSAGCYRRLLQHFPFYPGVRAALAELVKRRRDLESAGRDS